MTFKCELQCFTLPSDTKDGLVLDRVLELPIAPYPGLRLYGVLANDGEAVQVEEVCYDVRDGLFTCRLPDDQSREATTDELKKEFGEGWSCRVVELPEPLAPSPKSAVLNPGPNQKSGLSDEARWDVYSAWLVECYFNSEGQPSREDLAQLLRDLHVSLEEVESYLEKHAAR